MQTVAINATNVKVSNLNYSESEKELGLELTDLRKPTAASLSIKIPKTLVEDLPPSLRSSFSTRRQQFGYQTKN